ncbi:hypothetical protein DFH05DRAFT_1484973 [Lentinula detonsa]|uniref:Uncharacterized protein n=1 Tax=Lentinula detonsa TaxID=2804962 RepID=A0A9W8TZ62_9AGAR|nr:hypothetical protein DFH05DRAFT_1484973 [Lentinula detonsa]
MISSLLVSILLSTSVTYAMPTNVSALDTRGFFDKLTGNDIIIGYRWVDQNQAAAEINRYGTLRAIPATDGEKELLEGAYLSPSLVLRPDGLPSDYWEVCGKSYILRIPYSHHRTHKICSAKSHQMINCS